MFEVGELYSSPTGKVFRCTAWDWRDRSWWFHPVEREVVFLETLLKLLFVLVFFCVAGVIGFTGVCLCVDENSSDDIYN